MVSPSIHGPGPDTQWWISPAGWGKRAFDLLSVCRTILYSVRSFPGAAGNLTALGAFGSWRDSPGWVTFLGSPLGNVQTPRN